MSFSTKAFWGHFAKNLLKKAFYENKRKISQERKQLKSLFTVENISKETRTSEELEIGKKLGRYI